jgi:hypothetical protein
MAVRLIQVEGLQVREETGRGVITYADLEGQGRNVKVEIRATHTNLREPVTGWLDTQDTMLLDNVRAAVERNAEVDYVIHVKRKGDAPPETPIADLGNRQKVRELSKIAPAGSLPRQDAPQAASPGPQDDARPAPAQSPTPHPASSQSLPAPARSVRRGIRVEEARPWERHNTDGSVNLGSYEVSATVYMANLAFRLLLEKARNDAALHDAGVTAPTPIAVRNLATYLLTAADEVQATIRSDGCADRMDGSHRRARDAIREALDAYPVPWGADQEARAEWRETLVAAASMLLGVGVELLAVPLGFRREDPPPSQSPPPPANQHRDAAIEEASELARIADPELYARSSFEADLIEEGQEAGLSAQAILERLRSARASSAGTPA